MRDKMLALYNRLQQIHVLLDDGDRRCLNKTNLSSPQYHLLLHLHAKGDTKGLAITDLANLLICTRSNATRLVQRLEQQNLVKLTRDADDRRVVRVTLTPSGHSRFTTAQKLHSTAIKRRFGELSTENLQELERLSHTLVKILEIDLATND